MSPISPCYPPKSTLAHLPLGSEAVVTSLRGEGAIRRRLLDLGLVPGTRVKAFRTSPLGDPRAYHIRGAVIALRAEEARLIAIRPLDTAQPPPGKEEQHERILIFAAAPLPRPI